MCQIEVSVPDEVLFDTKMNQDRGCRHWIED